MTQLCAQGGKALHVTFQPVSRPSDMFTSIYVRLYYGTEAHLFSSKLINDRLSSPLQTQHGITE